MSAAEKFVLQVTWHVANMPSLIGPFDTAKEAREWGELNVPNGSFNAAPLAYPYMRSGRGNIASAVLGEDAGGDGR